MITQSINKGIAMINMNIARDLLRKAEEEKNYECVLHRDGCFLKPKQGGRRIRLSLRNGKDDNPLILLNGKIISRESESIFYNQALIALEQ